MIGVVVLNYNGWRDTLACLASLVPALDDDVRVVVVDNASTDDSIDRITAWLTEAAIPTISLVRSPKNGGFAAGNNTGIALLHDQGGFDYYWVLNNDTEIERDAIAALRRYAAEHPRAGLIGSTVVEHGERDIVQCAGGARYDTVLTLNRAAYFGRPVSEMASVPDPDINYVCGAAMLVRSEVVDAIGLLEEDYFLYYEEIDYARRAVARGFELGWCRHAIVYHKGGATTGGNPARGRKSALAEYHANLSCLKFTKRHDRRALPLSFAMRFMLKFGRHVATREWHLVPPLVDAYLDFLRGGARR